MNRPMNKPSTYLLLSFLLVSGLVVLPALATPPQPNVFDGGNRWDITAFDDSSPSHTQLATQGVCFLPYVPTGTGVSGKWYSVTFPNWHGLYYQEGDRVTMTGDYAQNVGHDGIEFDIAGVSPTSLSTGHWKEWRENAGYGFIIGWANARLVRVARTRCPFVGTVGTADTQLEELALEFSRNVPPRMLRGGGVAQEPTERGQLPVDNAGGAEQEEQRERE
jgi:hypothetical protein